MNNLLRAAFILFAALAAAQNCPDVADESRHEMLFENKAVRIFRLDLPRLASSDFHCHPHPYFRIIVTDSRTSESAGADVAVLREWYPGATRWILPARHRIRNDSGRPHREYIVETRHEAEYNPFNGNYDVDVFAIPADPLASYTARETRGALTARKVQLAGGTAIDVPPPNFVLIALSDLVLRDAKPDSEPIRLSKGDYQVLDGAKVGTLRNAGTAQVQFITVEF